MFKGAILKRTCDIIMLLGMAIFTVIFFPLLKLFEFPDRYEG